MGSKDPAPVVDNVKRAKQVPVDWSCVKIKVGQYQGGIVLGINKLEDRSVSRTSTSCTSQSSFCKDSFGSSPFSLFCTHSLSKAPNPHFPAQSLQIGIERELEQQLQLQLLLSVRFQRETAAARRICEAVPNVNKDNNQVIYD
ncbi:uncharacterized protein LOC133739355 isoform X3 [Rosa rugosa]|uniref:uncharacterized protein LOC133739355 isoform X3 n=1 Tax=Rosa rugosa TaxID=74645 RepID=UPI002B411C6D|nr:uncharacterized protein LOC133739355 isoform X3 [Rosa rugosa]